VVDVGTAVNRLRSPAAGGCCPGLQRVLDCVGRCRAAGAVEAGCRHGCWEGNAWGVHVVGCCKGWVRAGRQGHTSSWHKSGAGSAGLNPACAGLVWLDSNRCCPPRTARHHYGPLPTLLAPLPLPALQSFELASLSPAAAAAAAVGATRLPTLVLPAGCGAATAAHPCGSLSTTCTHTATREPFSVLFPWR